MDKCNRCQGEGKVRGYACPGFRPVELSCWKCGGAGEVDDVRKLWQEDGMVLKSFREARDLSLSEAADFISVNRVEFSKAEHGQIDPTEILAAWSLRCITNLREGIRWKG